MITHIARWRRAAITLFWVCSTLVVVASPDTDHRLVDAAKRRDEDAVRALIAAHADVNGTSGDGTAALHWADAQQMRQVLVNLVSNAQHAAGQVAPPRRVTIRTRALSQPARAMIEVIDNGPGIDPADRERVLEPFFTTKAVGQGMGLGLSVCHAIVTAHQGSLRLDSEPRRGTRVCVELPAAEGQN